MAGSPATANQDHWIEDLAIVALLEQIKKGGTQR